MTTRLFNNIGYYTDSTYYHYIKDHLGNVCAVINSIADTVVQSTLFYASGVPLSFSTGRDKQPYLYNGKEFIEAHGLNIYDYGFRGYYAPAGRFTTIDPLAEHPPWPTSLSPLHAENTSDVIPHGGKRNVQPYSGDFSYTALSPVNVETEGFSLIADSGSLQHDLLIYSD